MKRSANRIPTTHLSSLARTSENLESAARFFT